MREPNNDELDDFSRRGAATVLRHSRLRSIHEGPADDALVGVIHGLAAAFSKWRPESTDGRELKRLIERELGLSRFTTNEPRE